MWDSQGPAGMLCTPPPLRDEDIWEESLLESVGDEPVASLTPAEEALLLGEDWEPQGVQASTWLIPFQLGKALLQPDDDFTTDPQDIQQLPGCGSPTLMYGMPPLEEVPLVKAPGEAQVEVMSMASTEVITIRNCQMGEFQCCY